VIRALTLDCWGTLLLDGPGADDRYRQPRLLGFRAILAAAGVAVGHAELDRAYAESGRWLGRIWQRNRDVSVEEHVDAVLRGLDADLPGRLDAATRARLIDAYADPALRVPPAFDRGGAAALVEMGARGLRLAVISNTMRTPGRVLRRIFEGAGILAPFSVLTFSDECGIRKPDPEIFLRTLRQIGVEPEAAVHVGDDPVLDVEGARDAGMRVIQVAPEGRATGPVKPDAVISGLAELPGALDRVVA